VADWLMQVSRTLTVAVPASCKADAEEAAFAIAWDWCPEEAHQGDQGTATVAVIQAGDYPGDGREVPGDPRG
jgi:hypothetical protein